MRPLTIYLARLIGLFLSIIALAMLVNGASFADDVRLLLEERGVLLVFGLIALAVGLSIVLAHNRWSGGALAVTVTLFGWLFVLRGAFLLFLPADLIARIVEQVGILERPNLFGFAPLVLGLYLTYAGFLARPSDQYR
jgi:hypothetical protein